MRQVEEHRRGVGKRISEWYKRLPYAETGRSKRGDVEKEQGANTNEDQDQGAGTAEQIEFQLHQLWTLFLCSYLALSAVAYGT